MYNRLALPAALEDLQHAPALVLLGPRQVGKTTLALALGESLPSVYLDLQSESARARLQSPELYLRAQAGKLVILDEIHHAPGLFPVLRGLIDERRRTGQRAGQYLLLGSASMSLMRQSGESLAGRVAYRELTPLLLPELLAEQLGGGLTKASSTASTAESAAPQPTQAPTDTLWLRGGFPDSLLARSDARSLRWRQDFIRTYLERDVPQLGPRIAAESLRRLWTMLAHHQGGIVNAAALARSLAVDGKTIAAWLDLMVDLLLVRRLPPWHANVGKRLVKSPKLMVRDSGLLHALLGLGDMDSLLGHPVVGASWECFVIETLLNCASQLGASAPQASFYRSAAGAEVDLVLQWPNASSWAIEVKRSLSPKVERGFHHACEDLQPTRRLLVYPGTERYPAAAGIEVLSLQALADEVLHTKP